MQLNENTQLPYPCLNVNISDNNDSANIDFQILHKNLAQTTFQVHTVTTNADILNLIKDGKAQYCLEMDCRNAFYREAKLNDTGKFTVTLDNKRLNGKLACTLSVVATDLIADYKNDAFDSFFKKFQIRISPGEALAYLGQFTIDMQMKSLEMKNITDDFIEIVCDETLNYSRFDLGGHKILLKLPIGLYERYHSPRISENQAFEPYLHASFLLNILTTALQNIGNHSGSKWADTLHDRIETEDELRRIATDGMGEDAQIFDENGNLSNRDCAYDIAQCILANPYKRMFDGFDNPKNYGDE